MQNKNNKIYDLEDRTFKFASDCRDFVNKFPKSIANFEYGKQLIRSSSSVAANYIEANESLSRKDYFHRVKISRKESKESKLWLKLYTVEESDILFKEREVLVIESIELCRIFGSILEKGK